ncbi:DUF3077 domain-containing protein [Pseudomonas gingeri]|uniref:DUF3077 domain-containing protein n=1 Tax=Pseudomonas gingeri TaxID=117681 RepID=UPI0015A20777|nr:DUF3077 domain-containing protein [Pseudomonas gingeri]NWA28071.1 DUF3077 domain-containing protein [Pseudomonas gingeri]
MMKKPTSHKVPFGRYNETEATLFSVNAGIPLIHLLENASIALDCSCALNEELAYGDSRHHRSLRWTALQLDEMAKALIDAAMSGVLAEQSATTEQTH